MFRSLLVGTAAGAVGTVALNITTYLDMLVRGRAESQVPARIAGKVADMVGVPLAAGDGQRQSAAQGGQAQDQASAVQQKAQQRQSALGALMGYAVGLGVGAVYGLLQPLLKGVPLPLTGVVLGAAAMASSDVPAVRLGVTNPGEWGATGWASDIVPHLAYGLVTAFTYQVFTARRRLSR